MNYGASAKGYPDPTASNALNNLERRQRGLRSKRAGEYFETLIMASLNWYRREGLACVEKTPEPMKPLRKPNRQGQFLACYVRSGQPDFKGTLRGGKAVVFEAKHTDSDRISFSRLTGEQLRSLSEHYALGALAFVLVSFELQAFYRVPWTLWRDMKKLYGRKYLTREDLKAYRLKQVGGVIRLLD